MKRFAQIMYVGAVLIVIQGMLGAWLSQVAHSTGAHAMIMGVFTILAFVVALVGLGFETAGKRRESQ